MKTNLHQAAISLWALFFSTIAQAEGASHGINWWHLGSAYKDSPALGWLTITFFIFIFAMTKVIKKPLSLYLETRSKDIRKEIEEGRKAKAEGEQKLKLYEEKLRSLDGEIARIKAAFEEQAQAQREEKERLARATEERIMRDTDDTIRSNFERSKNRLAKEVIEKALTQAQEIIVQSKKDQMDSALKDALVRDFQASAKELNL